MSRRPSDPMSRRQAAGTASAVPALSVWACGQQAEHTVLREGGYLPGTARDRGRMPPGVAAAAIAAYSQPGQIVCDPDCGAGTVLVEALRAGRHAIGRPLGRGWWRIARGNVTAAKRAGAVADGTVLAHPAGWSADRTVGIAGRVQLVLTALRPRTGTADRTTPPPSPTGTTSRAANGWEPDAQADINRCLDRLVSTLAGVVPLLRPDGHVIVTVPPIRRADQTLADTTGGLLAATGRIGLIPVGRCVAITAQIRGHRLITRAGLDERRAAHRARAANRPVCLGAHHNVWIFQPRQNAHGVAAQPRPDRPRRSLTGARPDGERRAAA
jgi:modification methylase